MSKGNGKVAVKAEKCEIEACQRPRQSANTTLCHACYQSLKYHLVLGPQHVVEWARRVRIFGGRVSTIADGAVPKLIAARRKAYAARKRG